MDTIDTSDWPKEDRVVPMNTAHEFKAVAILDPHLSVHNPPVFKVDYFPIIRESVQKVIDYAIANSVDAFICGGDIFHLKTPSRSPVGFTTDVVALFKQLLDAGIPIVGIAGNHDIKYGHIETGLLGQPLNLLREAGLYQLLDEHEWVFQGDGFTVRLAGASYRHSKADFCRAKTKKGADFLVSVGHFWYGKQSGSFFGEPIYGADFLDKGEADVYIIGHHHVDQGAETINVKIYGAWGSLTRTGAHAHDIKRRPSAGLIKFTKEGPTVQILRPKAAPAEEIMDLDRHAELKEEKKEMAEFLESMNVVEIVSLDPKEVLNSEEFSATISAEVKEKVIYYLDLAEDLSS